MPLFWHGSQVAANQLACLWGSHGGVLFSHLLEHCPRDGIGLLLERPFALNWRMKINAHACELRLANP